MFLVTSDFEHNYFKKWCYASYVECKSCEIMYILEKKINWQTGYDINIAKQNYLVVPFRMVHLRNQRHI